MIRCAFYETEITPPIGSEMPGCYAEGRSSTGVLDRLYAKAVFFDDGSHQAAILVIDAVELSDKSCECIKERVQTLTGLAPECTAVCATHTHLGIPCGEPFGAKADEAYMSVLCRMAADCVLLAQQRLQPCRLRYGVGRVDGVSFNRDYLMTDGRVMTNPSRRAKAKIVRPFSENDPALPVLFAEDAAGNPLGALYSFACHQCCIETQQYSGDYSSEVSRQMKAEFGQEFVSIYLAGASGDINHIDFVARSRDGSYQTISYLKIGRELAAEAIRVGKEACEPVARSSIRSRLELMTCRYRRASPEERREAEQIASGAADASRLMLGQTQARLLVQYENKMDASGKATGEIPVQVIAVGSVSIYIMPGELYHQFGLQLRKGAPHGHSLVATLCNGAFGYIPVPEMFGTDVYPVQLCEGSMWEPETGSLLTERAIALARSLQGAEEK